MQNRFIRIIKTGLLLCVFIQLIGCNERSSTMTNRTEIDSATLNYLQNRAKETRENIDSVFQVYKQRFEGNYWYVSVYKCGKEDYKSISRGLDTIVFFFAPKDILYIDNKNVGTWHLEKINGALIWMNLNIENFIEGMYLPSRDYCFTYANDSVSVLQTRYGKSEDKVLTYQISLKRLHDK